MPTFRDDKTGLWAKYDPYEVSSSEGWQAHPERVWAWYLWRHHLVKDVAPNAGHLAVAAWQGLRRRYRDHPERRRPSRAGRQPNRAPSARQSGQFWCDTCSALYHGPIPDMPEPELEKTPLSCECGGRIRPGIVWFGEQLPDAPWNAAVRAVATADLVVVVGTSGLVYPAAGLPDIALASGTTVIEVNPDTTPLSATATLTLRETAVEALPGLLQRLPELLG